MITVKWVWVTAQLLIIMSAQLKLLFFISGSLGVFWFVLWLYLGFDSPATHPRISEQERKYIETSIEEEGKVKIKEKV